MKKLTIGSLVYNDFDGIYFSYQSIRLNNQDILDDLDLVVIDNNPNSPEGKATEDFCNKANIRYETYTDKKSTALRNKVFELSQAKHTICMDPHVMFEPRTIKNILKFYEVNPDSEDLHQGPMLMDCLNCHDPMTHMDPVWRDHMFGVWGIDPRGVRPNLAPFEIPMHGLGMFSCKTDSWLKFNEDFIGFGGEEGYIHEKYRKNGRTTWCLPFFRWLHRFGRPRGVPYPLDVKHRIHNYMIGFKELGESTEPIKKHFKKEIPSIDLEKFEQELDSYREEYLARNSFRPVRQGGPAVTNMNVLSENISEDLIFELPNK